MKFLLDTHVYLWLVNSPEKLPTPVANVLANPTNQLLLSICSVWEMTIKAGKGRLLLPGGNVTSVLSNLHDHGITLLLVQPEHVLALEALPKMHGDPFDRMIVAQANAEGATLISVDEKLPGYGGAILWR